MKRYMDYITEQLQKLLAIDSPSGFTECAAQYLLQEFERLGVYAYKTQKGGVVAELGGQDNGILLMAHVDTLGAQVAEVKGNGRLRILPVGGFEANNVEGENCRVYTYDGQVYDGTIQLCNASVHVNGTYHEAKRTFDTVEVVLDEPVETREDVKKLGIENGCYVCADPRLKITESGYIKSRFLDDKLSAAILLGVAKYCKETGVKLSRKVYEHFTVFEEVGHGASALPVEDVKELLSVDMGCVGDGLECTERQVSICTMDSVGPYNYQVVKNLIQTAREHQISYAADVYPHYGSDVDTALRGGADCAHGLIGPGVYASHGYERSHMDGVLHTFRLILEYLTD